jgi:hypothetical protein
VIFIFILFLWQNICHFSLRKKLPSNLHNQGNFWKKNSKRNQSSRKSYLIAKIFLGGFGHIITILKKIEIAIFTHNLKNQSGQWEGPGGGELNGCIMHQVHTSGKRSG